jgi:hypothetical protein
MNQSSCPIAPCLVRQQDACVGAHRTFPSSSSPSCSHSRNREAQGSTDTAGGLDSVWAHGLQTQTQTLSSYVECSDTADPIDAWGSDTADPIDAWDSDTSSIEAWGSDTAGPIDAWGLDTADSIGA